MSDPAELSLLLTILKELPTGVWVARAPACELVYANRTFAEMMGMTTRADPPLDAEALRYNLRDRAGNSYPVERLPYMRALRERRSVVADDMVVVRPDGSHVDVRAFGKPLFQKNGDISHVMVAFVDITTEVRESAAGAEARERLRTAVDHAPIILFGTDRDGRVTLSEGAGLRGMGFAPGQLVGTSVYEMYRDYPNVLSNMRRALGGESFTSIDELGPVVLESWMGPLRDEHGEVCGMIGVATDVTERVRLERQMTQADRLAALGRLAASVAHEINNPLAYTLEALRLAEEAVVALGVRLGDESRPVLERLHQLLGDATEGADRVRLITRDLKAFSRADEDVRVPLDLNRALSAAVKLVARRTGTRARIDLQLGPLITVNADENRLVQIFVNLLLNAADALPAGAVDRNRIRISTRVEGDAVVVEVGDNGPGISADMRARIFEPFFTTKPVGEGTGLGLFVTRNLVDALDGSVAVGEAPEGGALFSVRLPVDRAAGKEAAPSQGTELPPSRLFRILIIDDDPQVATLLRLSLESEASGCEVRAFTSGRAALEHLVEGKPYDLVFCDLMMAEISGMRLYEELRRRAPGREREMVFMTGGVFDVSVDDFLTSIPNDCVDKPFDIRAEVRRRLFESSA